MPGGSRDGKGPGVCAQMTRTRRATTGQVSGCGASPAAAGSRCYSFAEAVDKATLVLQRLLTFVELNVIVLGTWVLVGMLLMALALVYKDGTRSADAAGQVAQPDVAFDRGDASEMRLKRVSIEDLSGGNNDIATQTIVIINYAWLVVSFTGAMLVFAVLKAAPWSRSGTATGMSRRAEQ